mmetsp:Transcript_23649/g.47967  ORF Transcript_23649/g.47967 Transcript_23649/m.47967 type:complete len:384 (-) Transcript_23649:541-1692(-)
MELGKIPGLVHRNLTLIQVLQRSLLIPLLLESPHHQRSQLRVFLRRVQDRGRTQSQIHVRQRRFAQYVGRRGEIQDVVLNLIRQTQMVPEFLAGGCDGAAVRVPSQQRRRPGCVAYQGRSLVVRLPQIRFHLQQRFRGGFQLHDFARHQGFQRRGHDLNHCGVFQARQQDRGPRQQVIAGEDRDLVGVQFVHRFSTPAGVGLIQHVVVNEGRDVDHFHNLTELALFAPNLGPLMIRGGDDAAFRVNFGGSACLPHVLLGCSFSVLSEHVLRCCSGDRLGEQLDDGRSESLTVSLFEEVLRRHGQHRLIGTHQFLNGIGERLQLLLHHFERIRQRFDLLFAAQTIVFGELQSIHCVGCTDLEHCIVPVGIADHIRRYQPPLVFG